jgi:nitrite reductase/ring-hydroxylating ferredoxin subunit/uncharacterized membrane protein
VLRKVLNGFVDAQRWADGFGGGMQKVAFWTYRPFPWLKDLMQGTWLGHPLHPLLTDVPVGALTIALILDIFIPGRAADWATAIGVAAVLGAALAGYADYIDIEGKTRNYATVHSTSMLLSLVAYGLSIVMRFWIAPFFAHAEVWFAAAGYLLIAFGAYVGGELVFNMGTQVDRHAWRGGGAKWTAIDPQDLPEGVHTKVKAGGQTLVAVRRGERVYALHDICSHQGCSLSDPNARLEGDSIVCPCHGSRFRLSDGAVERGPAVFPQPAYQSRRSAEGKIEVRRSGAE